MAEACGGCWCRVLPEEGALHGAAGVGEVADSQLDHVLSSADAGRQRQQLVGEGAGVPGARDTLGAPPTPPQAQTGDRSGQVRGTLGAPTTPPQAQTGDRSGQVRGTLGAPPTPPQTQTGGGEVSEAGCQIRLPYTTCVQGLPAGRQIGQAVQSYQGGTRLLNKTNHVRSATQYTATYVVSLHQRLSMPDHC